MRIRRSLWAIMAICALTVLCDCLFELLNAAPEEWLWGWWAAAAVSMACLTWLILGLLSPEEDEDGR